MTQGDREIDFDAIHAACFGNETALKSSVWCGCYSCIRIFRSSLLEDWIFEFTNPEKTGRCKFCGDDSLLPDTIKETIGVELTPELLVRINKEFFGEINICG